MAAAATTAQRSLSCAVASFLAGSSELKCQTSAGARSAALPSLQVVCKESRIGKQPITVPKGVTITLEGQTLKVKGPLGELFREYPREVTLSQEADGLIRVRRAMETRRANAMHGLFRTLTDNMVRGVATGFEKKLQMVGVGYRANVDKNELIMNLGYSHQVKMAIPKSLTVKIEENTKLTISGRDKMEVGDFAANVRKWREPEPYKGKGIKYIDEVIRRKEGKVGKKK